MKKIVCDRCGKEIKKTLWYVPNAPYFRIVFVRGRENEQTDLDLCAYCNRSFREWLNLPQDNIEEGGDDHDPA